MATPLSQTFPQTGAGASQMTATALVTSTPRTPSHSQAFNNNNNNNNTSPYGTSQRYYYYSYYTLLTCTLIYIHIHIITYIHMYSRAVGRSDIGRGLSRVVAAPRVPSFNNRNNNDGPPTPRYTYNMYTYTILTSFYSIYNSY